jgi:hypothetical protein
MIFCSASMGLARTHDHLSFFISRTRSAGVPFHTACKRGSLDEPHDDVPVLALSEGELVPMRIERVGEGKDATISIFVDGIPVATDVSFSSLGTSSQSLRMGVFVEGETGRSVSLVIDDAEVVFRQE